MEAVASPEAVNDYFERIIYGYNCSDVRLLLQERLPAVGPLLASVVNGIDAIGGMMMGFNRQPGSAKRSVEFMHRHMALSVEHAKLTYSLVRCGLAHEATTKLAVTFFVHYERIRPGTIYYKDMCETVWLNATELAYAYLEAVKVISMYPASYLRYIPIQDPKDDAVFLNALDSVTVSVGELMQEVEPSQQLHASSSSAFVFQSLSRLDLYPRGP